ncbi:hypothetical protein [Mycolicibacterium conceptionense]|nr:hypothetical protein [Mycolicibacterium conceptionense]
MSATDDLPESGDGCVCCRNLGVLPAAQIDSEPARMARSVVA